MSGLNSLGKPELAPAPAGPMNRIGIYIRSYSETSDLPAMQETRIRETIAGLNRYHALGEVTEVFIDRGHLFDFYSRPGLRALMRAVRAKRITLVFVPEFRDLATLPRDLFRVFRFLDRHRCGLRSPHEYLLFEDLRFGIEKTSVESVAQAAPDGLKAASEDSGNEPAR